MFKPLLAALLVVAVVAPSFAQDTSSSITTIARPPAPALKQGETQLFVDDDRIHLKRGLTRVVHPARKLERPVLEAEGEAEVAESHGFVDKRVNIYGTVLRDEATGKFRMWYAHHSDVFYAESDDGLKWQRPTLNIKGANNKTNLALHSPSIVLDRFETDPARRYKAVGNASRGVDDAKLARLKAKFELVDWYRDKVHRLYYAAHSADGLRWTVNPEPILLGCDTITLAQDPTSGEFLAFHKRQGDPRVVGIRHVFLSTSRDFEHWSEPQPALVADELDNKEARKLKGGTYMEFYNMSAFAYGGQWLGMATPFRRVEPPAALFGNDEVGGQKRSATGLIDVQLTHSRDGRRWLRSSDRSPIVPLGPHPYDAGSILGLCNGPVVVGDELWVYYTAMTTPHGGLLPEKELSIALAMWRLDGFASLRAGDEPGYVETEEFVPEGERLLVNADVADGTLKVEVLDAAGDVIAGFEQDSAVVEKQDGVRLPIAWKGAAELPQGKPIRLRFHLQNGDLYSYRIE